MIEKSYGPTEHIAERAIRTQFEDLSPEAITVTKQCLLDIIGVTLAGAREPLTRILREEIADQGGHPQASLFGSGTKANLSQAALINGAAAHAHDYDDVNTGLNGHPTAPVAPAVLALSEHGGRSGKDILRALATGIDAECLVRSFVGGSHYHLGWHATSTFGTFGAAAASAQLLGLDVTTAAQTLGIAGTQAAGLKAVFGTMTKPLHAGHAAATGITAASLAKRGFSSRADILEVAQGFGATQSRRVSLERFQHDFETIDSFVPNTNFKYHAACYLTHSSIEATNSLRTEHNLQSSDVANIEIKVDSGHFKVCNIQEPGTGLEAKFSLRFATAMALHGVDTAGIDSFNDKIIHDPTLIATSNKTNVIAFDVPTAETRITITTTDGRTLTKEDDVAIPLRDLDLQWQRLETKFRSLVDPLVGSNISAQLISWCHDLENREDLREFWEMLRGQPLQ